MTTIQLFGDITSQCVKQIIDEAADADELKLLIHSDGGDCSAGLAIYDYLRGSDKIWHTEIVGSCHSIASIILLGADAENRTANANSSALIHNVASLLYDAYTAKQLEQVKGEMEAITRRIQSIYIDRTALTAENVVEVMNEESIHDAEWLLANGFVSKINDYTTKNMGISKILNSKKAVAQVINAAPEVEQPTAPEVEVEEVETKEETTNVDELTKKVDELAASLDEVRAAVETLAAEINSMKEGAAEDEIVNKSKEYTNAAIEELKGMIGSFANIETKQVNAKATREDRLAAIRRNMQYTKRK